MDSRSDGPHSPNAAHGLESATARRGFFAGAWPAARYLLFAPPYVKVDVRDGRQLFAWIVPVGLLIGLAWVGLFRGSWKLYGEGDVQGLRLIPALALVLLEMLVTGRLLVFAAARAADDARIGIESSQPLSARGTVVMLAVAMTQWALIVSIPHWSPWWPTPDDWRSTFNFLYPRPIYRPLLLAPLWGRWALLLAASVGRTANHADPLTAAVCASATPSRVLRNAIAPLLLSCIYFSRERNFLIGGLIGLGVLAISYLTAVILSIRCGGQTRTTIFATGQIAQLAFLAIYRAAWGYIYL